MGDTEILDINELTGKVIGCAIEVHRSLGPGILESAYEQCLAYELDIAKIPFKLQWPLPIDYKGTRLDCGYRWTYNVGLKRIAVYFSNVLNYKRN
jgi:GxxExxY protein